MKSTIISIFIILFIATDSFGGAWLKPENAGYTQLSYTWLKYSQLINARNNPIDLKREVQDFTLQFYGEYGLDDKVNIIFVLPYKILATSPELLQATNDPYASDTLAEGRMNAFSNPVIGLKFPIFKKKIVLSAQLNYALPVTSYNEATGLRSGFMCSMVSPFILLGRGWNRSYFNAEAGVVLRSNNYADYFRANIEYGYKFKWKKQTTWIAIVLDAMILTGTQGYDNGSSVQTGLYVDGSEHISPGLKLSQSLAYGFSFDFGIYGAVYSVYGGKNPTVSAGLSYAWEKD